MTPVIRRPAAHAARRAVVVAVALLSFPRAVHAQGDTTRAAAPNREPTFIVDTVRVTYRTRELVFFAAGREQGIAVGDTVDLLDTAGVLLTRAVVLSTSQHSASARLLDASASVSLGARAVFTGHPREAPALAVAAAPDTAAAPAGEVEVRATPMALPPRRSVSGGLHLDQFGATSGAGFTSSQTALGVSLEVPLGNAVTFRVRTTSRYRNTTGNLVPGGVTTIPYQVELQYASNGGRTRASLGRFLATDAFALGYFDGARVELLPTRRQRLGVAVGLVPDPVLLHFSTATKRVGAWWGLSGDNAFGTVSVAADWSAGAHRRTVVGLQTSWTPLPRVGLSLYGDADLPAAWDSTRSGPTLTSLYGNVRLPLPGGFRFGIGAETHETVRQWEMVSDTFALPGRYVGLTSSLGHDVGGVAVDLNASALKRTDDPTATLRGMLSLSRGAFYAVVSGEHGPIADYGYATGRLTLTRLGSPVAVALGGLYGLTSIQAGGTTIARWAVRPDITWRAGRGLLFNAGGDFGRYGGSPSNYLHAGMSYYFH